MSDIHAYRASAELADALTRRAAEVRAWATEVADFDDAHPDTPLLWSRAFGGDRILRGFADKHPDQSPPDGLSRAQTRVELIPKRGRAGEPWREVMRRFERQPSIDRVLRDHDVSPFVIVHEHGRSYSPGLLEDDGKWWVTCRVPLFDGDEHPHLTPVPLSAYYTAREAAEARQALVKETS